MNLVQLPFYFLMVASMVFCFFNDSYAMALIFVSSAGLFSFLEYNKTTKEREIQDLKKELAHLSKKIDQVSLSRLGR